MAALAAAPLAAQGNGTTGGVLLELAATPRQVAFQGAYSAVVGDEGSVFVNPAGMAPIRRLALGISQERGLFGTTLSTGAAALRVGRFDLGLGVMYMDLGGDSVVVPDPAFGGDRGMTNGNVITAWNGLAVGALAYRRGMISIGASVKYLQETIGDGSAQSPSGTSGVTGDVGAAIALFDIMAIGFTMQNLTGRISSAGVPLPLPRTSRFGLALNIVDPQGTTRLLVTSDLINPPGGNSWWAFGVEGGIVSGGVGLLGRAGLAAGRGPSARKPWSLGGEIVVKGIRLEYAYQGYDVLATGSHRFGLRWVR
jgi:hypothetical protein